MSSGPVGKGISYWATIKISAEMQEEDLKKLVQKIKDLLGDKGKIVDEARASTDGQSSFSVAFRKPGQR